MFLESLSSYSRWQFAARHGIRAQTEHYSFDAINDALARLDSGEARYRIVLSH
jgi:uncharacterized zinc-type alcohol dehydrogenase-like protein